jgi:transcriptional regulator with XRE-family HTH domain
MNALPTITPIEIIELNALLDAYRDRHGITSDEKLAKRLGVSDQAIYRWRRGEIASSALILLSVDRELANPPEYSTAA